MKILAYLFHKVIFITRVFRSIGIISRWSCKPNNQEFNYFNISTFMLTILLRIPT